MAKISSGGAAVRYQDALRLRRTRGGVEGKRAKPRPKQDEAWRRYKEMRASDQAIQTGQQQRAAGKTGVDEPGIARTYRRTYGVGGEGEDREAAVERAIRIRKMRESDYDRRMQRSREEQKRRRQMDVSRWGPQGPKRQITAGLGGQIYQSRGGVSPEMGRAAQRQSAEGDITLERQRREGIEQERIRGMERAREMMQRVRGVEYGWEGMTDPEKAQVAAAQRTAQQAAAPSQELAPMQQYIDQRLAEMQQQIAWAQARGAWGGQNVPVQQAQPQPSPFATSGYGQVVPQGLQGNPIPFQPGPGAPMQTMAQPPAPPPMVQPTPQPAPQPMAQPAPPPVAPVAQPQQNLQELQGAQAAIFPPQQPSFVERFQAGGLQARPASAGQMGSMDLFNIYRQQGPTGGTAPEAGAGPFGQTPAWREQLARRQAEGDIGLTGAKTDLTKETAGAKSAERKLIEHQVGAEERARATKAVEGLASAEHAGTLVAQARRALMAVQGDPKALNNTIADIKASPGYLDPPVSFARSIVRSMVSSVRRGRPVLTDFEIRDEKLRVRAELDALITRAQRGEL